MGGPNAVAALIPRGTEVELAPSRITSRLSADRKRVCLALAARTGLCRDCFDGGLEQKEDSEEHEDGGLERHC